VQRSKPYAYGIGQNWRWYANFYVNAKLKKGNYSVNILERITPSRVHVWRMRMNKFAKFHSHIYMDFENIPSGAHPLT
jgi:hypothetical protein